MVKRKKGTLQLWWDTKEKERTKQGDKDGSTGTPYEEAIGYQHTTGETKTSQKATQLGALVNQETKKPETK